MSGDGGDKKNHVSGLLMTVQEAARILRVNVFGTPKADFVTRELENRSDHQASAYFGHGLSMKLRRVGHKELRIRESITRTGRSSPWYGSVALSVTQAMIFPGRSWSSQQQRCSKDGPNGVLGTDLERLRSERNAVCRWARFQGSASQAKSFVGSG